MQNRLPHHTLSEGPGGEAEYLRSRFLQQRHLFRGHSHWLSQLLMRPHSPSAPGCIDWTVPDEVAAALELVGAPREVPCGRCWCSRRCLSRLPPESIVVVLCALKDHPHCRPLAKPLLRLLEEQCSEVRDPITWTITRHDGPNHLGL